MLFIGGFTTRQVLTTATRIAKKGIVPIIDYAKEGNATAHEAIKYTKAIEHLSNEISVTENRHLHGSKTSLALKLSSFLPLEHNPNVMANILINHYQKTGCQTIMFDAEQPCLKPLEDNAFNKLAKRISCQMKRPPILFKTFQAYRQDTMQELTRFVDLHHDNPNIGIKLVRGAYWKKGDNTFYQRKELTDDNYNRCLNALLTTKTRLSICVATHNKHSIGIATSLIPPNTNQQLHFAQLLGMANDTSQDLLNKGYKVMKYVPYGTPKEMVPYLGRRLVENISILQHIAWK
jgi:proline dehydrogenase